MSDSTTVPRNEGVAIIVATSFVSILSYDKALHQRKTSRSPRHRKPSRPCLSRLTECERAKNCVTWIPEI
jgi:hypothetical protein